VRRSKTRFIGSRETHGTGIHRDELGAYQWGIHTRHVTSSAVKKTIKVHTRSSYIGAAQYMRLTLIELLAIMMPPGSGWIYGHTCTDQEEDCAGKSAVRLWSGISLPWIGHLIRPLGGIVFAGRHYAYYDQPTGLTRTINYQFDTITVDIRGHNWPLTLDAFADGEHQGHNSRCWNCWSRACDFLEDKRLPPRHIRETSRSSRKWTCFHVNTRAPLPHQPSTKC